MFFDIRKSIRDVDSTVKHKGIVIEQQVSHYKIIEILSEGGLGVVYKAHARKLDRDVAQESNSMDQN